jgi:hypothetical protein
MSHPVWILFQIFYENYSCISNLLVILYMLSELVFNSLMRLCLSVCIMAVFCVWLACSSEQYTCSRGQCIEASQVCDGTCNCVPDCEDENGNGLHDCRCKFLQGRKYKKIKLKGWVSCIALCLAIQRLWVRALWLGWEFMKCLIVLPSKQVLVRSQEEEYQCSVSVLYIGHV